MQMGVTAFSMGRFKIQAWFSVMLMSHSATLLPRVFIKEKQLCSKREPSVEDGNVARKRAWLLINILP